MAPPHETPKRLKELLDAHHEWPSPFTFKFVVAKEFIEDVKRLLPDAEPALRPSANGAYMSVTFVTTMASSEAVLEIYERARHIKGLIAL